VTITAGLGLSISPAGADVAAGGLQQFAATLNSLPDNNVKWSVSAPNGGNPGSIDPNSGLFTAPPSPPIGSQVIITATDSVAGQSATATATITYADASFSGPFAFSYTGNSSSGFQAVVGSLVADGKGNITSGIEDIIGLAAASATGVPISGAYVVGPDGRGTITLNSGGQNASTIGFTLTTNQHILITRLDASNTGSGTMDQQNLGALGGSALPISGPYAFRAFGADKNGAAEGIAGAFTASPGGGGTGTIPAINSIVDLNDGGTVTASDTTLQGTYAFDNNFPGTGRGTLTLTSTAIKQLQFSFYIVDGTHLYILETDGNAFLSGDMFSGQQQPAGGGQFTVASLAKGNYPFTVGGNAGGKAYSAGGVFVSDGNGNITSASAFDNNAGGTVTLAATTVSCAYTVDPATGRINMFIGTGMGGCMAGQAGSFEFAAYQTSLGKTLMLEIDTGVMASGTAFTQTLVSTTVTGNFALSMGAQGVLHGPAGPNQQDAIGQLILNGASVTSGNLDINAFNPVIINDPIATTSTIATPNAVGRGTAILNLTNPQTTYNIVYYLVDANTALLFGQASGSTTVVQAGALERQF